MVWPTLGSRTAKEQEQERITDRSFQYASPCLWNQLPASLKMKITENIDRLPEDCEDPTLN